MQSLFALQQCKEADYELALDLITSQFTPDLNSMEVQDKVLLTKQKKKAEKLFKEAFEKNEFHPDHEDPRVKKTVSDAFDFYLLHCKKDADFFRKNMVIEAEKIYHSYIGVLALCKVFVEIASADKKISHTNFIQNSWMKAIAASDVLANEMDRLGVSWNSDMAMVKTWFRDVVRQDNEYLAYLDTKEPGLDRQKKFTNHLFRKIILGNNNINGFFEEQVLRWAEDRDIVKGLVEKTIKSFNPEQQKAISLHALSLNWEDDKDFIEKLYLEALDLAPEYADLIAQNTRNWEVDRLPLTDRIILEMAIAELLNFPNIPVKVTINEYIELAKDYSTPKSRQFINGILDVIAKELKEKGDIKKSGRGLIDNK